MAIALICAVGVIGVETYLLLEPVPPLPPAPPVVRVIAIPLAAPQQVVKAKAVRSAKLRPEKRTTASQRPFEMPTGGIFSGVDPQDPRIYHFNAE